MLRGYSFIIKFIYFKITLDNQQTCVRLSLGQAIATDARPGEDHVAVGGSHFDGIDHLDEVDPVAFGKEAPLILHAHMTPLLGEHEQTMMRP